MEVFIKGKFLGLNVNEKENMRFWEFMVEQQ